MAESNFHQLWDTAVVMKDGKVIGQPGDGKFIAGMGTK